jgi:phospholipid N-methyltransferase
MNNGVKASALTAANSVFSIANLELVKKYGRFQNYIPYKQTIDNAKERGLSVGDYIDTRYNIPGATQATIEQMKDLGALHPGVERVCELGPGSGRYLDKTIQACHPTSYEIYETATEWRKWLVETYNVVAREADGISLAGTPTGSVDLVHSHKVLQGLPIFTVVKYLQEMIRVINDSGTIVFDHVTEACLTQEHLQAWLQPDEAWIVSMLPKQFVIDYFDSQGFRLIGNFFIAMLPGITEYFVFRR